MHRRPFHLTPAGFAQRVARKFSPARLLLISCDAQKLGADWHGDEKVSCASLAEFETLSRNGKEPRFNLAIWFYPPEPEVNENVESFLGLAESTDQLLLIPSAGADSARRRAELVRHFVAQGLFPDYDADMSEFEADAILLARNAPGSAATLVAAVENAFARANQQRRGLRRTLQTRMSELEEADRHIAQLEEKLLKLKEYRRTVKQLKAEKQALHKSPERKVGQVLLAPYLLPQRLVRGVRKHWPKYSTRSGATTEYEQWFAHRRVTAADIPRMHEETRAFAYRPRISIITPVYNTPASWLRAAVESVLGQIYGDWEFLLIDDGSSSSETINLLAELASRDQRITVKTRTEQKGISAATNDGLEIARGEFIGFLDHDDVLEPDALFQHVQWLQTHREADLIYSDEDKLTEEGLDSPILKPDWSPDYFRSCNYICHFTILRRELLREVGGFRSEFDGAQDYDLFFRVIERGSNIDHIPRVLYHWRRSAASTSDSIRRKPKSLETGRLAVEAHLKRTGVRGHVAVDWRTHAYWVKRDLPVAKKISIIIPVRDGIDLLKRCLASLTSHTSYEPYEIVVVDNDSRSTEAREFFENCPHRRLHYSGPFNFSAINNFAVQETDSPWLLFLNNDMEIIDASWLATMAEHVQRPEVGAVGPRLLFPDDTVQHAGVVVGVGGIAQHAFRGFPAEAPGVCRQLQVTRNYSAVTGACLLTRREVFDEVGGFDEERLPVNFSDVDLCLKMRRAGYLIVYTPFAKLYHHESASRRLSVEPRETAVMRERWGDVLLADPYYNPNLSRDQADFSLGEPIAAIS